ncbi:site-specific integrase [Mucilaginibacter sp. HMF5004]|uniref:site-specific integrase n=1 Tax=Mucilaginibacter rivuli TaxID=2857527 RepID=UPI001C60605A|nr:site-specific integrase [Mucilaginibacter rivuli]MBW4889218.1 site-specific integrase [Mucilaginibacter rivuli]
MSVIKVVLRKKPKADGTCPLALRIYKNGKESYIYLGYYISPDNWDVSAQRVKKSHPNSVRFNNLIATKVAEAMGKTLELEASTEHVSSAAMKQKVKPRGGASFFGQAKMYIDTLKEAGKYNRYTADKSKIEHFREFCGSSEIAFTDITVAFLERFKQHCITKLGLGERTAINHWVVIRSVFSQAIKNQITDPKNYPFGRGKIVIKFPDTKKIGFAAGDVQKLENVELVYALQNHSRNVWLFSFYFGGMRGSDVLRLRWSDFRDGRLYYTMGKNLKPVSLKVPDKAQRILEFYIDQKKKPDDLVFPELKMLPDLENRFEVEKQIANSICRIDKLLTKKVAPKAGITTNITMHIARHSFGKIAGDTIALTTAQKLFRHSDIATTMGYMNNFVHKDEDEALDAVINFKASNDNKKPKQAKENKVG